MEWLQNQGGIWVAVVGLVLLVAANIKSIPWGKLWSFVAPLFVPKAAPVEDKKPTADSDAVVIDAVENFLKVAKYCEDCPEAHEDLRKLWEHIDPSRHANHELYKPKEPPR